jgi:hypothetical protein
MIGEQVLVSSVESGLPKRLARAAAASAFAAMLGNALSTSTLAASSVTDWPTLSHDPHHSGYVASPTPNSTTASTLGLNWMAKPLRAGSRIPRRRFQHHAEQDRHLCR